MKPTLHPLVTRLLNDAQQLTQSAKLSQATAAIQRALGTVTGKAPPAARDADTLDGLVREVPASPGGRPPDAPAVEPFGKGSFSDDSGSRNYKLYVPPGSSARPRPLIVMLHGCTQDPDDFAAGTRMNEHAERGGFIVLYPAQAPRSNSSKCWNWFQPGDQHRDRGEPALLAAMTRHIVATQNVDPARVYVAGLSAGGAMAAILGHEYADVFAAAGVHSGLPPGAAHDVASAFSVMRSGAASAAPVGGAPVIVFHGDHDQTVHPGNGERVIGELQRATAAQQRRGNAGRDFTQRIYRDADHRVRAEHWLVHGAGHAWSGGSSSGSFTDASGPDASAEMVRFFLEHPGTGCA